MTYILYNTHAGNQHVEQELESLAVQAEQNARENPAAKEQILGQVTELAVQKASGLLCQLWEEIRQQVLADGGLYGMRKEFLEAYTQRVQMPL